MLAEQDYRFIDLAPVKTGLRNHRRASRRFKIDIVQPVAEQIFDLLPLINTVENARCY